ncbi:FimV/HubP family polar landmark protein [Undibacterium sp. RTI2.1]|uniref:FimV/HubP family polar landmark protein n=1 Tax=unclassified Undibacterium TaxID=2630295 RepID=UPI002AB561CB|nr:MULTISPECIES: FimV/HubP family polar landmark protein [unclassified Undibacterium]MDY7537507.1 FimV/HubP family polar landmark protein [Undibacterium sp. 5I1]MEB0031780.1 FimV/HubP family polar landmark protein [Undibacterium sp. RTI2.1]MEB0117809.1 FimV/HubP family polar landmark protein [Undibacterium sp. RTI2.2]MEB0230912.1 FimV/HubP family polar landmark protein [Undibacterium sp. 10I3]MEB0258249.1 FimV/HubP family polar landmark protein [Undibacterium sp. 5I1]
MFSSANATGLGKLTVLSALGQPLRAEIELTSPNKDEIGSLVPKLASADAFRQASIDLNPALLSLRFSVEQRGSGYVIRVSSNQAMNEPFVDMLLELNSSNGKLLREYTFLLDPAELRNSQSAQVANPVNVPGATQSSSNQTSVQSKADTGSINTARARDKKVTGLKNESSVPAKSSGDYQVKMGDTLSKIAGAYKSDGVSLDQMLVSLYKANPQAFAGNNMNRLKSGQILSIPDVDASRSISSGDAHSTVMAHAADFSAYRNKLAGQVERAPAEKVVAPKQTASGVITAKVKEVPTATNEALDKLKLSKATPSASAKSTTGKVLAEEDKLAKDKAIADANARVKELEKNVEGLQKILQIKDKDLSDKQAAAKKMAASTSAPVAPINSPAVDSVAASTVAALVPASSTAATPTPAPKRKIAPPPPPPPEPGIFDGIMSSGFVYPIAAILALLGGYGFYSNRRKKSLQQFEDSILTGSSMKANSMFGSTGGQSVDTNNSVFNSNFAPSASQLDANEVDPVAEADVYIAYGRDSQAEEILKEALRTQPDRHAVRVKLLEIYFTRKDVKSFERLAGELYGMTSGDGDDWAQAASMGIVLDPHNPLYAGGKAQVDSNATGLGSGTQPLEDLDPDALLANSLSHDMLESISIIDTAAGLHSEPVAPALDQTSMSFNMVDTKDAMVPLDFDLDTPESEPKHEFDAPQLPMSTKGNADKIKSDFPEDQEVVDFASIDFDLGNDLEEEIVADTPKIVDPNEKQDADNKTDPLDLDINPVEQNPKQHDNIVSFDSMSLTASDNTVETHEETVSQVSTGDVVETTSTSPAAFEFDLSGIDFDLDNESSKPDTHDVIVAETPSYNAEMATKLDLAVAYHEIGDKDGARELLDEVIKGGTRDQIAKAQEMLTHLS